MPTLPPRLLAALLLGALTLAGCGDDPGVATAPSVPTTPPATTSPPTPPVSTPPATTPAGVDAAASLVDFARGAPSAVPWADQVTFTVATTPVATMEADRAARRSSWRGCLGPARTYEGRDCPVSLLATLAADDLGPPVYEPAPPDVIGCSTYRAPTALTAGTTIWIRPAETDRSCFTDYAVAVSLDRRGRVQALDLALSGP